MTDDLDVSLRRRLERLAASVPVDAAGAITSVTPGGVRARSGSRLALGGLVPVIGILVVGVVLAGIAKFGPFASGTDAAPSSATAGAPTGPIEATSRSGDFQLTIRSAQGRYEVGELMQIEATLTYLGDVSIQIAHAMGAQESAMAFGIEEPVLGDLHLGPTTQDACVRTALDPGQIVSVPFQKSGGFNGDDPRAEEYRAFFADPELRLAEGIWHVYAVASFSPGNCSPDPIEMRVDLEIEVVPKDDPAPGPSQSPPSEPAVAVHAVDDDGTFRLDIRSAKSTYTAGEPIDIAATLQYLGDAAAADRFSGGILFSGSQTDGPHGFLPPPLILMCSVRPISDLPQTIALSDWPKVRSLPAGTWRISASFSGSAPACEGEGSGLKVSIDLRVFPATEAARAISLLTSEQVDDISSGHFCRSDGPFGSVGNLALHPTSGLGLASADGDVQPVRWPPGFTAELLSDGAILYGDEGQIVGREGEAIGFPAGIAADGVLTVCGQFLFP